MRCEIVPSDCPTLVWAILNIGSEKISQKAIEKDFTFSSCIKHLAFCGEHMMFQTFKFVYTTGAYAVDIGGWKFKHVYTFFWKLIAWALFNKKASRKAGFRIKSVQLYALTHCLIIPLCIWHYVIKDSEWLISINAEFSGVLKMVLLGSVSINAEFSGRKELISIIA